MSYHMAKPGTTHYILRSFPGALMDALKEMAAKESVCLREIILRILKKAVEDAINS